MSHADVEVEVDLGEDQRDDESPANASKKYFSALSINLHIRFCQ